MLSLLSRTHGPEYLGQQFPLPVHLHEAEVILVAHGRHVHPQMHARDLVAGDVDRKNLVRRLAGKRRATAHALQIGRLVPEGRAALVDQGHLEALVAHLLEHLGAGVVDRFAIGVGLRAHGFFGWGQSVTAPRHHAC
jgi:hypothetical protein